MVNIKFLLVVIFLVAKNVNAEILIGQEIFGSAECTGSLLVVGTTDKNTTITTIRFSESKKVTGLYASSLRVEGCGCFYLYKRRNFKSTSKLITHHMTRNNQNISGDYIGFNKIKSIEKVSCEGVKSDEGSFWTAGVGVVGGISLLVVIAMAAVGVKCYKKYKPVSTATLTTPPSTPSPSLA